MRRAAGVVSVLLGVVLAAAAPVRADQEEECVPRTARELEPWREGLRRFDFSALTAEHAKEAQRIGDSTDVLRFGDRLYLALDGGRLASLKDCRFGDGLKIYLYETYDTKGGFYVVGLREYEDFSYMLVQRRTGTTFRTSTRPLWSPDTNRFVHGQCELMNGPNAVQVVAQTPIGLRVEATIDLPCQGRNCAFSWENATSLSIICRSASQPPVAEESLKLVLRDGAWTVVR
jgi:hypothetical protein